MPKLRVTIIDEVRNRRLKVDLPDDAAMEKLLPALAKKLGLPPAAYQLTHEATGRVLGGGQTLASFGVREGDALRLAAKEAISLWQKVPVWAWAGIGGVVLLIALAGAFLAGRGARPEPTPTVVAEATTPTATSAAMPQPTATPVAPTPAPTAAPSGEAVTIQMMVVDYIPDKTDKWLVEEVIPAFQKEHPNINVEFVYVNWGTLDETIQGCFAVSEGADIINLGSEYIAQYGDRLAPLDEYFTGWDGLKQFVPGTLESVTWEGKIRGLPWLTAPRAYMCRTDILTKAGWKTVPKTFAEMVKMVKDVTVVKGGKLEIKGFQAMGASAMKGSGDYHEFISLIWTLGGKLYKEDGTPDLDSKEARAALQYMHDIHRAEFPDNTIADVPEMTGPLLASDKLACYWGNLLWGAPAANDPIWEKIELVPGFTHPDFPKGKPVVTVFNDWLGVPQYSKHVKEAAEFLKFLGSAENLNAYNSHFGSFPPREDAWVGFVEKDLVMQKMGKLMADYGVVFADVRESPQFRDILHAEVPLYLMDEQDLDTTLQNIQTQYTGVLKEAGRIK